MIVRPGKDEHDDEAIGNECTDDDSVQYFSTCEEAHTLLVSYSLATLSHRPMLSTTVYIHGDADWLSGTLALKG